MISARDHAPPPHAAARAAALAIDVLLFAGLGVIIMVALTGGAVFTVSGARVSLRSTDNPAVFCTVLACLRYLWLPSVPFFGRTHFSPARLDRPAALLLEWIRRPAVSPRTGTALAWILAASASLRLINAWVHPGFTTGDDVEIHEMSLGLLLGKPWDVWNLRSSLYPLGFVYPVQALAHTMVGNDVQMLVFGGRLVVVLAATASVWLLYRATRLLSCAPGTALLAAGLLASSRLHLWYGSSELPRPVAAAFVLAAFWLFIGGGSSARAVLGGVLLGLGGSLRFSEFAFLFPAFVHLAFERRWGQAFAMSAAALLVAGVSLAVSDSLYWGRPFFSLINAVDYTLVQRASSRGFQPPWYYAASVSDWTNVVFLGLGLYAVRVADWRVALWTWLPVLVLSALPHKEPRYLIASLPFLCMGVALTLATPTLFTTRRRRTLGVLALAGAVVFEASNWHAHRSDEAVRLAQVIRSMQPAPVALQQAWRFGGRLYLSDALLELPEPLNPAKFPTEDVRFVVLLRESAVPAIRDELARRGFASTEALSTTEHLTFERQ